jgi:hypothetical protein
MNEDGRLARVAPVAAALAAAAALAVGIAWRSAEPPRPEVPLADRALALAADWKAGRLRLDAGPPAYSELPAWSEARGGPPVLRGRLPRLQAKVEGAGVIPLAGRQAVVAGLGADDGRVLLVAVGGEPAPLLGRHAERLLDEWNDFAFEGEAGRVVVWSRGGAAFALAGDAPIPALRRALPPPDAPDRIRPPEGHFRPPGTTVPSSVGSPDPIGP